MVFSWIFCCVFVTIWDARILAAMISGIAGSTRKHSDSGPGSIKPPAIS